jgi:ribosomal protein L2
MQYFEFKKSDKFTTFSGVKHEVIQKNNNYIVVKIDSGKEYKASLNAKIIVVDYIKRNY